MRKCHLLTILLTLLVSNFVFSSSAFAQKIKVRRVKGNQAVVEFTGGSLQQGQAYELVQDEYSEASSSSSHRRYALGLSFNLTNTKSDAAGSTNDTNIATDARFGWNFNTFEIGPLFTYSSATVGTITTSTMKFGGWADFNLIQNVPGELFIYGLGGEGAFGQSEGGGTTLSIMQFQVAPFVKWFPIGSDVGFRIDLGYLYQRQSGGTAGDVTVSGIVAQAGLIAYFF